MRVLEFITFLYIGDKVSPVLKEALLPLMSLEMCLNYTIKYHLFVSSSQICAGYDEGGNGTCNVRK